jgi:serine/threonine-protein kinase HipA
VASTSDAYLLSENAAREIVDHQIEVIEIQWDEVCKQAKLSEVDKRGFWQRQFLNPYTLFDY